MRRNRLLDEAHRAIERQQYDRAVRAYRALLSESPHDVKLTLKLAELYIRMRQLDAALNLYEQIAQLYISEGELVRVTSVYKLIVKIDPSHIIARAFLFDYQLKTGEDCNEHLWALYKLYTAQGDVLSALDLFSNYLEREPSDLRARRVTAQLALERGDYSSARIHLTYLFDHLLEASQEDDRVRVGERLLAIGDAPDEFKRRVTIELCELYLRRGAAHLAMRGLQSVFKADPKNLDVLLSLGRALHQLGHRDRALKALNSVAIASHSRGDLSRAIKAAQLLIEIDPHNQLGHKILSSLKGPLREEASSPFIHVSSITTTPEAKKLRKAHDFLLAGSPDQAFELIREVLELDATHRGALELLLDTAKALGNHELFQSVKEAINEIDPDFTDPSSPSLTIRSLATLEQTPEYTEPEPEPEPEPAPVHSDEEYSVIPDDFDFDDEENAFFSEEEIEFHKPTILKGDTPEDAKVSFDLEVLTEPESLPITLFQSQPEAKPEQVTELELGQVTELEPGQVTEQMTEPVPEPEHEPIPEHELESEPIPEHEQQLSSTSIAHLFSQFNLTPIPTPLPLSGASQPVSFSEFTLQDRLTLIREQRGLNQAPHSDQSDSIGLPLKPSARERARSEDQQPQSKGMDVPYFTPAPLLHDHIQRDATRQSEPPSSDLIRDAAPNISDDGLPPNSVFTPLPIQVSNTQTENLFRTPIAEIQIDRTKHEFGKLTQETPLPSPLQLGSDTDLLNFQRAEATPTLEEALASEDFLFINPQEELTLLGDLVFDHDELLELVLPIVEGPPPHIDLISGPPRVDLDLGPELLTPAFPESYSDQFIPNLEEDFEHAFTLLLTPEPSEFQRNEDGFTTQASSLVPSSTRATFAPNLDSIRELDEGRSIPNELVELILHLFFNQQYSEALDQLALALLTPTPFNTLRYLSALCKLEEGQWREAFSELEECLKVAEQLKRQEALSELLSQCIRIAKRYNLVDQYTQHLRRLQQIHLGRASEVIQSLERDFEV